MSGPVGKVYIRNPPGNNLQKTTTYKLAQNVLHTITRTSTLLIEKFQIQEVVMKLKAFIISICMCLFVVGSAWAVPFPVDLNYSSIAGNTGITYATVYGTVIDATTFQFDIIVSDDFLMKNFYFNTDLPGVDASDITNIMAYYDGLPDFAYTASDIKQADGFGNFDIAVEKRGKHNVTELKFDVTVTGLTAGTWTADDFYLLSTGTAEHGNGHFAAQIWDKINDPTGAKTFFARDSGTPKVPEPNTMILLGSGLLGLAFYGRRKFRK
jgi:hypothetical protein